jgi:hypothetical protein
VALYSGVWLSNSCCYLCESGFISFFALNVWQSFDINQLAIWCDNALHFRNKAFLAYLLKLVIDKFPCRIFFQISPKLLLPRVPPQIAKIPQKKIKFLKIKLK